MIGNETLPFSSFPSTLRLMLAPSRPTDSTSANPKPGTLRWGWKQPGQRIARPDLANFLISPNFSYGLSKHATRCTTHSAIHEYVATHSPESPAFFQGLGANPAWPVHCALHSVYSIQWPGTDLFDFD